MNIIHMLVTYIVLHRTIGYSVVRILEEIFKYIAWSSLCGIYYSITYFVPDKPEKQTKLDDIDFLSEDEDGGFVLIKTQKK